MRKLGARSPLGRHCWVNSFLLYAGTDERIYFRWSAHDNALNSSILTLTAGVPVCLRVKATVATGAVAFYTSTDSTT